MYVFYFWRKNTVTAAQYSVLPYKYYYYLLTDASIMRGETHANGAVTMNARPQGGDNMNAGTILTIATRLGLTTQRGSNYVSPYHAAERITKEAQSRPSVSARAGIDLPAFAAREDGTSRITIYTGGDDVTISNRKGLFNFNIGTRHLCACGTTDDDGTPCIGKNGHAHGLAAGDFTGSLCGINHPDTPTMPTIEVREGADFHRTIKGLPLMTAAGVVKGNTLTERVGGGARGLNTDAPEYRRNRDFRTVGGCPSCGRGQCWGKVKSTGVECWPSMQFAFVNVTGAGWVYCYLEPSRSDYSDTLSLLDSMGSKVHGIPVMGAA